VGFGFGASFGFLVSGFGLTHRQFSNALARRVAFGESLRHKKQTMASPAIDRIVLLPEPRKLTRIPGTFSSQHFQIVYEWGEFPPQGYRLSITERGITVAATDDAGKFYAVQTLEQLQRQFPGELPCLGIEDYPDFPVRGVMLDISRDKVPTMETLFSLVDQLAEWKINQLQLYIEHTFAYSQHRRVWRDASPMTAEEIQSLDAYCRQRFIELVPNQNSFGHMERWLKHPEYEHLAETLEGAETPFGYRCKGPFSLCPIDPASVEFLRGLYAEFLPNFTNRLFNVGCDETFDVGQGRSKAECEWRGVTAVYLDFLRKVNDLVASHGRTMMFWGDIIIHKPEMIAELPKNAIALEWGYEADHPFDREGKMFADAGVPFYVCPGTSSWNSIAGRTDNALANLKNAAENGLKQGAIGYLITDWGDHGHLQYLPISYLGFAAGAAYSWCLESNRNLDIVAALDVHVFNDSANILGRLAYDLGNIYQFCSKPMPNASALFRVLVPSSADPHPEVGLTLESLSACESAIISAVSPLDSSKSRRSDAGLIADEFRNAAAMLLHAIQLARAKLKGMDYPKADALVSEHRRLWLARNRPGGLEESVGRLL
jgi:hexosaminidase